MAMAALIDALKNREIRNEMKFILRLLKRALVHEFLNFLYPFTLKSRTYL